MTKDNTNYSNDEQVDVQAKALVSLLDENAQRLSMRTLKKLEDSRAQAIDKHQKISGTHVNADGTLSHWTSWLDDHRTLFSGLVLLAAISTFLILQNIGGDETSDAFLLGADLPPEAFVDRGFEPSLNKNVSI